jgi:NhaA family Na+:H+ antiporter
VPSSLVVFLLALAIFDDLGAIVIIALFYGGQLDAGALWTAGGITVLLAALTWSGVTRVWPYVLLGIVLWVAVLKSGIHATIAGVVLGLCIPARARRRPSEVLDELDQAIARLRRTKETELDASGPLGALERHLESVQPPLDRLVHGLHAWVAFLIVPVFAIANAGVSVHSEILPLATSATSLGVMLGLLLGKPLGIFTATWLAVRLRVAPLPTGATWVQVLGVSVLAGIGFTMSIFVATLAFPNQLDLQDASKIGVFVGSLLSALAGLAVLRLVGRVQAIKSTAADLEVVVNLPRFAEGFRVEPWVAAGPLVGMSLRDIDLRRRFGVSVIGVYPAGRGSITERVLEAVGADYQLAAGDTLLVVGKRADVDGFLVAAAEEEVRGRPGEYGAAFPSARPPPAA